MLYMFQMKLQLKGHVIIVDEAHNIEDQCREAASLQLDQTNLNLAKMDCEKMSKLGMNPSSYAAIVSPCDRINILCILLYDNDTSYI